MIRKARLKDLDAIWKLLNSAEELRGTKDFVYSKKWVREIITNPIEVCFVYVESGEIAGVICGEIWKNKGYSYLADVIVSQKHRRKGIATQLFKHYENFCKKNNVQSIFALAKVSNKKIHEWNKKMGFRKGEKFYYFDKNLN
ncbi:GNAT family N-acetyltransferase [Candidatus Woesearchaeota archaeon]|nr:GNAT family N-acetyltransferase [Candidatus Woesearchaeota archaeon]MBW3022242.1 GNAT family N-acetyltransferase [Candidatus Woesearchaeota archaeon]